jgi:hypothetical protein
LFRWPALAGGFTSSAVARLVQMRDTTRRGRQESTHHQRGCQSPISATTTAVAVRRPVSPREAKRPFGSREAGAVIRLLHHEAQRGTRESTRDPDCDKPSCFWARDVVCGHLVKHRAGLRQRRPPRPDSPERVSGDAHERTASGGSRWPSSQPARLVTPARHGRIRRWRSAESRGDRRPGRMSGPSPRSSRRPPSGSAPATGARRTRSSGRTSPRPGPASRTSRSSRR